MTKGLSWEGQVGEIRNPTCRTPSRGTASANAVWVLRFRALDKSRRRKGRGCRKPGHS